ncbi:hypothetical protein TIFTF001_035053 [Ficus carica]|uniref:Uncharacterized protein n=1 Tax=Ficus carica TaxID=3494 RepID=A0AA88E9D1_FICCA|nr:hypothetical protein TIFTF001_035046 [Ficus carica]GMN65992.1 hypothetical protein TIFTF001_035053 [Ficus carica]
MLPPGLPFGYQWVIGWLPTWVTSWLPTANGFMNANHHLEKVTATTTPHRALISACVAAPIVADPTSHGGRLEQRQRQWWLLRGAVELKREKS